MEGRQNDASIPNVRSELDSRRRWIELIVRALIVDDELHAREGIRIRLKEFPDIEVVGECSSGSEAVAAIEELRPDLLFLDIQMPEMNGFEVLRTVNVDRVPIVVFVTAYDKYAVKAFEFHALDYLLKPIGDERFRETVKIALSQLSRRHLEAYAMNLKKMVDEYLNPRIGSGESVEGDRSRDSGKYLDRLAVKTHDYISMLPVSEIDWIESAGDYVYVHADSHKYIIRQTLSSLEGKVDPRKFVRIHRTTIVNVEKVKALRPNEHGDFEVFLKSGERLKLSRSFRSNFQRVIGKSF